MKALFGVTSEELRYKAVGIGQHHGFQKISLAAELRGTIDSIANFHFASLSESRHWNSFNVFRSQLRNARTKSEANEQRPP